MAAAKASAPEIVTIESTTLARPGGSVAARARVASGLLDVLSPDPAVRWRFGGTGTVQRSSDGGVSWTTQRTGTTVPVSAGSSPSPLVCWLVGRAGTVLLSTNGVTWRLRSFPEGLDLVGVHATDAKTATVTTSDGRQYSTADGGMTWSRLQEPPPAPFYQ
jgi:photosystem II stability/assembly factor-like uncharacterized protein